MGKQNQNLERQVDKNGRLMALRAPNGDFMSTYTPEMAKIICDEITLGKSLRKICIERELDQVTVYNWMDKHPEFYEAYGLAKEKCADYFAEDIIDVAEETPQTFINKDGNEQIDNAWVNNQKNRLEARKWAASVYKPRKYGNQTNVNVEVNVKLSERLEKVLKNITPEPDVIENSSIVEQKAGSDIVDGNLVADKAGSEMLVTVTDAVVEESYDEYKINDRTSEASKE